MTEQTIRELLESIRDGRCDVEQAVARLRKMPFEDLGFAKVDHHRGIRCGFPEVIYAEGKTPEQVTAIFGSCAKSGGNAIATRATPEVFEHIARSHPDAKYNAAARTVTLRQNSEFRIQNSEFSSTIAIVAAGTSDIPVAEEAREIAEMMDQRTKVYYDVGVAGIHRLLVHVEELQSSGVIVAVAGMEGALPSVVGGLVDCPVIAVPTSIGYGASFHGIAALLAMLNTCASGVTVVNINNGFGAGYAAALINRKRNVETSKRQNVETADD